ncbi:hypothetical protein ABZ215_32725, partial [Amycolatopsis sp. NPDC006131]|uniref:hypothetical protein n=1 Tax=Amycolatopsis sp. NPDC006131 TaxID=3156731 RepID=UPI0033B33D36
VAFRFVHITLSQGRKLCVFGCRTQRGLRPWLKVIAPVSGDGMTTQLPWLWAKKKPGSASGARLFWLRRLAR